MAKIDVEKLKESVASFVENPHWKKYMEEAPSGECKKYIQLNFYYSDLDDDAPDKEPVTKKMDELEDRLSVDDWKYLLKYAGRNQFAGKCRAKIEALTAK